MNTLRLSTLSLSLVVAVLTLGYANPSFAAPKKCDRALPGTPGCGGGNNTTGIEYTVELMGRVFHFDPPPWMSLRTRRETLCFRLVTI